MNFNWSRSKLVAAGLLSMIAATGAVLAQGQDAAAVALDAARRNYERAMEAVRVSVHADFDQQRQAAARAPSDKAEEVERIRLAVERFMIEGELPDVPSRDRLEQAYARAAAAMQDAFLKAKLAYGGPGNETSLADVTRRADQFNEQWDLAPWQDRVKPEMPVAERTPKGPDAPVVVDPEVGLDFRLEVVASASGSSGTLVIDCPLEDGRRQLVSLAVPVDAPARLMLTIDTGEISIDMGNVQLAAATETAPEDTRELRFTSQGGPVTLDIVRVKPILIGQAPEVVNTARQPAPRKESFATGVLPRGATGAGTLVSGSSKAGRKATVRVNERGDGDIAVLGISVVNGERFRVTCRMKGTSFDIVDVRQTSPPRGKPRFKISKFEGGSGEVRNGVLNLQFKMRGTAGRTAQNRLSEVRVGNVQFQ